MKGFLKINKEETGAYSVLAACVAAALITFAGYSINATYARSVSNELQAAADAAAHAAAKSLCASEECWRNALTIADKVIWAQLYEQLTGQLGTTCLPRADGSGGLSGEDGMGACDAMRSGTAGLLLRGDLTAAGFFNIDPPVIQRGRWTPETGFEQVDAYGWQEDNPGKPQAVYSNAVRIQLTRKHITIMKLPFVNWDHSVSVEAVAVADSVKEENIAPFAIPVCALMERSANGRADFQADVSNSDRLFARSDRYCPAGDCNILPAFPYGTCENDPARYSDDPNTTYLPDAASAASAVAALGLPFSTSEEGHYCLRQHMKPTTHDNEIAGGDDWALHDKKEFSQIWNHYGVVGLPEGTQGAGPGISETDIQSLLSQALVDRLDIRTKIGDRFYILGDGLSASVSGSDLWSIISGASAPNETRVEVADSNLGTLARNLNYYYASPGHASWLNDMAATQVIHNQGLCSSKRMQLDSADSVVNGEEATLPYEASHAIPDDVPVWKVKVPVIADVDDDEQTTCPGISGAGSADSSGAPPNPSHKWEVIGFVTVEIFDVSIGDSAPRANDDIASFPAGYPYGFETDQNLATRESCNVVRARIVGETNFVAGSNTDKASRRPVLISRSDY